MNEELIPFNLALADSELYELVHVENGKTVPAVFVGHDSGADPEFRVLVRPMDERVSVCYTEDGRRWSPSGPIVLFHRPKLDADPVDPSPGNKAGLRKSQVGAGWRIPAHEEPVDSRAECWMVTGLGWAPCRTELGYPYHSGFTYRVPIDPPKPKTKTVPLTAEDIPLGAWVRFKNTEATVVSRDVPNAAIGLGVFWWHVGEFLKQYPDATISADGGNTWGPMTKEVES